MSKLHNVYLEKKTDMDHAHAILKFVKEEGFDINETDENGDTVLHLMASHIFENFYNPFFEKSNPTGAFNSGTGYKGHFHGTNYQGPAFFDDLRVLLAAGADPTIENKQGLTPVDLFYNIKGRWVSTPEIVKYFKVIQTFHPDSNSLISLIKMAAFTSGPKFKEDCFKWFGIHTPIPWINTGFINDLDERLLSLDCLRSLVKWILDGELEKLGASAETVDIIKSRLIAQIECQQTAPFFIEVVERLCNLYKSNALVLFRGMLVNDPASPIQTLIEQLSKHPNLKQLILEEQLQGLQEIISEYEQRRQVCEESGAIPKPLDEPEHSVIKAMTDRLDEVLNGKAKREKEKQSNYEDARTFMNTRRNLFMEKNKSLPKNMVQELDGMLKCSFSA